LLLPAALVLCHTVAFAVEPLLFLPERYVAYAVPFVALAAAPSALAALRTSTRAWLRCVPIAYNIVLVVLLGARGAPWTGFTVNVPPEERPLYAKLATLPKNTMIAAIPSETTDSVPYLTRRSVFLARETHMPFHSGYAEVMRRRTRALFSAYFAPTEDELVKFRNEWGITHVLLDTTHFATRPTYFVPFDAELAAAFERGKASGFALSRVRARTELFTLGKWALLDLDRL
jgi:hypothetical protein